ncbi:hypothetical protein [Rhodococcus sp. IEGM 1305]|uniref:hypothetical protein n=1 Tax=Rhodococcus sp. IEGM 1305 TaxID=3047092 RepID=UPI0024B77BD2|nr:hypothetical protein [Rhodococcus sp. IEGM 1305]MDI9948805.1 hypothetical protein [Rhodococcus sp. IEGM 1305]
MVVTEGVSSWPISWAAAAPAPRRTSAAALAATIHPRIPDLGVFLTGTLVGATTRVGASADADGDITRADAAPEQISRVALTALRFWRSQAGRPAIDTATVQACACAARSCESLLAR